MQIGFFGTNILTLNLIVNDCECLVGVCVCARESVCVCVWVPTVRIRDVVIVCLRLPAKNLIGIAFKFVCHAVELTLRCPYQVGGEKKREREGLKEIMTADSKSFSAKIGRKSFALNNSQKSSNINRFINFRAKSFNKQNYSCMYTLRHVCSVIEYASKLICHWSRRGQKEDRERSLWRQREREACKVSSSILLLVILHLHLLLPPSFFWH